MRILSTAEALAPGLHTFKVRAIDSNGKAESSYGSDTLTIVEEPETYTVALPMIIVN